tara:strand:- start:404 stop:829 length:426 start_codon:yes stop_codon:yes gene_type:complete
MKNIEKLINGTRFQCQGSGKCCVSRGGYGFVYLNKKDIKRFANFFNIKKKDFIERNCVKEDGNIRLKEINLNGNCIYLKHKKCSVYAARPEQCRTWPFWPENMNTKKWKKEIINFCPGIGKGKFYSPKEIKKILVKEYKNN